MSQTPETTHHAAHDASLERLARLAETLGAAGEFVELWRALRDFAHQSVPCIGIFISLYDPAREVRTAVYAYGDETEVDVSSLPPMPVSAEGPNSRAVRTRQVVITNDYWNMKTKGRGQLGVLVGPDNGLRPQSSLVVPMMTMGRVVGTVEVQSYEDEAYGAAHVTAMRMAANLAAVAVENMRLLERERGARAEAEESNRLKDEFLATLSHELRTPLTAILGWAGMLRTERLDPEASARALEVIERNARTQKQIVDDILDVSRVITGKLRLDLRPVELTGVVRAAVDAVRPTALARQLTLEVALAPHASTVLADPDRLQQVVWNLLTNAVKFTPQGGRVRVTAGPEGGRARVRVEDTGVGIPLDFLPHVFDRFRQADGSTTRAFGGIGLGLSIVLHLVEMHGGHVTAESEGEGRGSCFTVELPLVDLRAAGRVFQVGAEEAVGGGGSEGARAPSAVLRGVSVLVVDDDRDTLELITAVLARDGAEVSTAETAAAALEAFAARRPDVLLSDIGMPVEDGYAFIRRVRELESAAGHTPTPAAALTAYAGEANRERALRAGYQSHLPKPIDPAELVEAVAELAQYHKLKEPRSGAKK